MTVCLAACGGSEKPAETALVKAIIPAVVPSAASVSEASAPVAASTPAVASAPAAVASAPVEASAPQPGSTPVVNIDVYGDDAAMGLASYGFGMPVIVKPASASLQDALQGQFNDTGIKVANRSTGGRAASLMNALDGMDGGGPPLAARIAATQSSIVLISYGLNEQYGGETVSDFSGYLAQAIQIIRDAKRLPVLETPSPTCDSAHPFTASYAAAIKAAGMTYNVPVVDNYAAISALADWRSHMDATCILPDEALQVAKGQQELSVISPMVKSLIK